ncbi:MAG: oxygenase MpaB family protein [Xenococcaceae cyanobacterium]
MAQTNLQYLNEWNQIGDPLADEAVKHLYQNNLLDRGADSLEVLRTAAVDPNVPDEARTAFSAFLEQSVSVPSWVDFAKLRQGQEAILRYGVVMSVPVLSTWLSVLAAPGGVEAELATNRVLKDMNNRNLDVAEFIRLVYCSDSLLPGTEGHDALRRTRLIHSGVRNIMLLSGKVNPLAYPISQIALVEGSGHLCIDTLRGMEKLGCRFSQKELEAVQHLWRYANHVVGIVDDLQTETWEEMEELYIAIRDYLAEPTESGRRVAEVVIEYFSGNPLPKEVNDYISRKLIGDQLADFYGLGPKTIGGWLVYWAFYASNSMKWILQSAIWGLKKRAIANWKVKMREQIEAGLDGRQVTLYIPVPNFLPRQQST